MELVHLLISKTEDLMVLKVKYLNPQKPSKEDAVVVLYLLLLRMQMRKRRPPGLARLERRLREIEICPRSGGSSKGQIQDIKPDLLES